MNNQLVKRMHTIGKVGKIIAIVVIVLSIIATVFVTAGAIAVTALPKDTISVNVDAQVDVTLNKDVFGAVNEDIVSSIKDDPNTQIDVSGAAFQASADLKDGNAVIHGDGKNIRVESGIATPILWFTVFNMIAFIVCAFFFKGLMKELSLAPSPFTEGVVRKMKFFAIAILAASVATSIVNAIIGCIVPFGGGFSFSLNIGSIITAVIIFVLAVVFRYGAQLQKESDETL